MNLGYLRIFVIFKRGIVKYVNDEDHLENLRKNSNIKSHFDCAQAE